MKKHNLEQLPLEYNLNTFKQVAELALPWIAASGLVPVVATQIKREEAWERFIATAPRTPEELRMRAEQYGVLKGITSLTRGGAQIGSGILKRIKRHPKTAAGLAIGTGAFLAGRRSGRVDEQRRNQQFALDYGFGDRFKIPPGTFTRAKLKAVSGKVGKGSLRVASKAGKAAAATLFIWMLSNIAERAMRRYPGSPDFRLPRERVDFAVQEGREFIGQMKSIALKIKSGTERRAFWAMLGFIGGLVASKVNLTAGIGRISIPQLAGLNKNQSNNSSPVKTLNYGAPVSGPPIGKRFRSGNQGRVRFPERTAAKLTTADIRSQKLSQAAAEFIRQKGGLPKLKRLDNPVSKLFIQARSKEAAIAKLLSRRRLGRRIGIGAGIAALGLGGSMLLRKRLRAQKQKQEQAKYNLGQTLMGAGTLILGGTAAVTSIASLRESRKRRKVAESRLRLARKQIQLTRRPTVTSEGQQQFGLAMAAAKIATRVAARGAKFLGRVSKIGRTGRIGRMGSNFKKGLSRLGQNTRVAVGRSTRAQKRKLIQSKRIQFPTPRGVGGGTGRGSLARSRRELIRRDVSNTRRDLVDIGSTGLFLAPAFGPKPKPRPPVQPQQQQRQQQFALGSKFIRRGITTTTELSERIALLLRKRRPLQRAVMKERSVIEGLKRTQRLNNRAVKGGFRSAREQGLSKNQRLVDELSGQIKDLRDVRRMKTPRKSSGRFSKLLERKQLLSGVAGGASGALGTVATIQTLGDKQKEDQLRRRVQVAIEK